MRLQFRGVHTPSLYYDLSIYAKLLWREPVAVDISSRWREDWQSATVMNSSLVDDPTIRQHGFDFPRLRQSSLFSMLLLARNLKI